MEATKEQIGGASYSFGVIPPTEAIKVEVAICRVIGEPLFKAMVDVSSVKKNKASKEAMISAVATAVGLLTSRMDADELIDTMTRVFKYVSVNGERINIDVHFNGKNMLLWQVFIKAVQLNFSDFFTGSLLDSIREQIPAEFRQ